MDTRANHILDELTPKERFPSVESTPGIWTMNLKSTDSIRQKPSAEIQIPTTNIRGDEIVKRIQFGV